MIFVFKEIKLLTVYYAVSGKPDVIKILFYDAWTIYEMTARIIISLPVSLSKQRKEPLV